MFYLYINKGSSLLQPLSKFAFEINIIIYRKYIFGDYTEIIKLTSPNLSTSLASSISVAPAPGSKRPS